MAIQNDGIPVGALPVNSSNNGIPAPQPLYQGLSATSTPAQIAAAYSQFVGGAGGDTTANQDIARSYLTNLGISAPTIEQSYNQFLQPAQIANTAGVGTQGIGVNNAATQGLGSLAQATANPNVLGGVILGGDSYLSNGYVANNLATNLGQHVTNTAIGGQTTTDVLNQLNNFTGSGGVFNPGSTVVLNVGGNDLLQGVDKATVQSNLNTIVSRLGALGVNVVLSGASDVGSVSDVTGSTNLAMADLYNNVARNNKNVTLVDSMSGLLNDKSLVTEDGFHLTNPGLDRFSQSLLGGLSTSMGAKQPTSAPIPSYEGITAASTPDEIARAYYKFTGEAGGDTTANQDTARTFLESLGIATPTITEAYKDYNELAGLKSSFGVKDGQTAPTQEGILSGFKYANDNKISDADMEQVLGKDVFSTYKTGFADYAKTGIANILADNQLSFDEARTAVKFGRDYGYDSQKLADLTGTKKEVFDTIYKNYDDTTNKIVDSVLGAEDVKTNDDKIIRALALQDKFGFTDDDLAKAADFTPAQVKEFLDPVRNFGTDLNKILSNTDSTLAETKNFLDKAKTNGAINQLYGTKLEPLDAKIAEMEDRWKGFEGVEPMHAQRVYDQIDQQREKLGGQYYRGVFGDPKIMAATLAKKGIDTLADIVQKDKYEATPAEKIFLAEDGTRVFDLGNGTFGVPDAEGGTTFTVPKSQVKTTYGYTENELRDGPEGGYYESKFVPLSGKDVDKEGNYQKLIGKVAIDKDTGKEIADINGQIAHQSSSGGLKKKSNSLNVAFTKDGVPVLTASSQRAGLGALVQDLAPMIAMALPFMLPGVGAALSGMLPGAGVAASGATAAIAPTLLNQALTQGIISGGLTTLGGGQFEKGFLGGAVSPVIGAGVSNFLPNISTDMSRMITNVGTGAVRGALQGGEFKDLLAGGITSGLADYGVNTALGASGLTPQQLNFVTGIAAPLLQGDKINPVTAFGTLVNAGQQTQRAKP